MNEVRKLDNTELAFLDEACNRVAHNNWDGHVSIEQSEQGVLDFKSYSEEDELEAHYTATWASTIEVKDGECRIYAFFNELDDSAKPVYISLVPVCIVGLLGL